MFSLIIQECQTHLFLAEGNEWKKYRANAKTFTSRTDAIAYCFEQKIAGYQLVLHFDDSDDMGQTLKLNHEDKP